MFTENRALIQELDSELRARGMSIESAGKLFGWTPIRLHAIFDGGQLCMEERCQIMEQKFVCEGFEQPALLGVELG